MATTVDAIASKNLPDTGDGQPGETASASADMDSLRGLLGGSTFQAANEGAQIPNHLTFAPSIDPRLKITKPFAVRIERCGNTTVAHVEEIEEFGYGDHSSDAVHDLGKTIAELYFSLEQQAASLGPGLQALKTKLDEHIRRVRP